jgi:capsular polysaccharide transport system permease protein
MDAFSLPPKPGELRFRRLRVLSALVIREMGTKFGRSIGGYAWALAEPLGGILLLAIVFSLALRTPPLGTNFMLFYSTGVIPYYMFNTMANGVSRAVQSNKALLNYPAVHVLDAVFAKFVLNFMTIFLVAFVMMGSILLFVRPHVNLELGSVALSFTLAALLGLGVGTMNCVLFGLYPTWKNVWGVLTRPLFIVSSIFYLYESVSGTFKAILWWNPLVHIIALMRSGIYGAYDPQFISIPYVTGIALALFVTGAYLLRRHTSLLLEQ